jgi:hypothetical protein
MNLEDVECVEGKEWFRDSIMKSKYIDLLEGLPPDTLDEICS